MTHPIQWNGSSTSFGDESAQSSLSGFDIYCFGERFFGFMRLAYQPVIYHHGKPTAAASEGAVDSSVECYIQVYRSFFRLLRSVVPSTQHQLRSFPFCDVFFRIVVPVNLVVRRIDAGYVVNCDCAPIPVYNGHFEGVLAAVPGQNKLWFSVSYGKISLPFGVLGLRRQKGQGQECSDKCASCGYPSAHCRKPSQEATALRRAAREFHGARYSEVNDKRENNSKGTQPVPKTCRLHFNPPLRECGLAIVLRRPWLFFCQDSAGFFVLFVPVGRVMNARMAEWVQGNDRINIIRPAISPSIDVVAFEIWLAAFGLKWRWSLAAFANAFCSAESVGRNGSRAVVNVSFPSGARPIVACVYRLLPKRLVANPAELFDFRLEYILGQYLAADQIEYDLGMSISFPANLDFMVSVVKPFAFETILAILLDKEENGPPVLHVVSDLVVIVVPGVTFFCALTVVLIATVCQKLIAIAVGVTLGVGHHDNRIFSIIAVADPHHLVATKSDANVCASMKNLTNVFVPRHVSSPLSLPQAVSTDAGCIGVKEDR